MWGNNKMRVFLACTNTIENKEKKKNCKYILESFYSGEKNCLKALKNCSTEYFLLDSGAFSYMSGAKCSKESLLEYLDRYIAFINKYNIIYFFELDVDTIFGIDFVEQMRKKLESETGKQCIPVWHKGRGIDYWKKMVKEYKYVAIGGLVFHVKKQEWPLIKKMVDYAYKRNVKVHGLGFTKTKILEKEKWKFFSIDSSSWLASASRGQKLQVFKNGSICNLDIEKRNVKAIISKMAEFNFIEWCKYQKYMDLKNGN